ncbi:MAG: mechanosensitive ion channel domain-containing protein [Cyanobacteria bacterium J06627_8]
MSQLIARRLLRIRLFTSRFLMRAIALFIIFLSVVVGTISAPALSQAISPSLSFTEETAPEADTQEASDIPAPIMVDGRVLFRVGSIDGFSAETRAQTTNEKIERILRTTPPEEPIQVFSRQVGDLTTIRIQNNPRSSEHLLTVTEGDFITGVETMEQAQLWKERLQPAIERAQRERTPQYRRRATYICIALLAIAIFLHLLVQWLRRCINRYVNRGRATTSSRWILLWETRTVLQPLLFCLQIGVWIVALIYFSDLFPVTRFWRYRTLSFLLENLTSPIFELEDRSYSTLEVLKVIVLVIGLWIGVRTVTAILRSRLLRAIGADPEIQDAIALLIQSVLIGVGLILILQGLGFDVGSLAIVASVLGVGIGFGLQNIANNFISGLVILFERPIRVGDFINVGDLTGTVERIGARSTEIRTLDYVTIIVPNSEFIETKVVNWSHGHPVSRLHVPFGVAYSSGIRHVRGAVLEAVKVHPEILRYPQPQIWFQGFGDSSLDFDLLVWIREPRHKDRIRSDLYYLIEANFRRNAIEIPFPQRDLHVRSPHVDDLVGVWSSKRDATSLPMHLSEPGLSEPNLRRDKLEQEAALHSQAIESYPKSENNHDLLLSDLLECSLLIRQKGDLVDSEIDALVEQMRGPEGIEIKDRRYRLRTFSNCFVGNEAVQWLMQYQKATHEEALRIGQLLVEKGIFHHVTDEHTFEDAYLFYRFYEDEMDE